MFRCKNAEAYALDCNYWDKYRYIYPVVGMIQEKEDLVNAGSAAGSKNALSIRFHPIYHAGFNCEVQQRMND